MMRERNAINMPFRDSRLAARSRELPWLSQIDMHKCDTDDFWSAQLGRELGRLADESRIESAIELFEQRRIALARLAAARHFVFAVAFTCLFNTLTQQMHDVDDFASLRSGSGRHRTFDDFGLAGFNFSVNDFH